MGSVTETALEVVTDLNKKGEKVGLIKVILYRPFSASDLVSVIPSTCKVIAVMDRTKEKGAIGEPLYEDVVAALDLEGKGNIKVIGGRYGLGSHGIGVLFAIVVTVLMLLKVTFWGYSGANHIEQVYRIVGICLYGAGMLLCYTISTVYHES